MSRHLFNGRYFIEQISTYMKTSCYRRFNGYSEIHTKQKNAYDGKKHFSRYVLLNMLAINMRIFHFEVIITMNDWVNQHVVWLRMESKNVLHGLWIEMRVNQYSADYLKILLTFWCLWHNWINFPLATWFSIILQFNIQHHLSMVSI